MPIHKAYNSVDWPGPVASKHISSTDPMMPTALTTLERPSGANPAEFLANKNAPSHQAADIADFLAKRLKRTHRPSF
jgi:hypothetical protein